MYTKRISDGAGITQALVFQAVIKILQFIEFLQNRTIKSIVSSRIVPSLPRSIRFRS